MEQGDTVDQLVNFVNLVVQQIKIVAEEILYRLKRNDKSKFDTK